MPGVVRNLVLVLLGLMIGATLDPEVLGHLAEWPVSLCGVVLYVVMVTAGQYVVLHKVGGYDVPTAYFCAARGGFMAMTAIGGSFGGQERKIALTYAVRVVLAVSIIVMGYHLIVGQGSDNTGNYVPLASVSALHVALLIVIGPLSL